jgi:hypothetical protein
MPFAHFAFAPHDSGKPKVRDLYIYIYIYITTHATHATHATYPTSTYTTYNIYIYTHRVTKLHKVKHKWFSDSSH